ARDRRELPLLGRVVPGVPAVDLRRAARPRGGALRGAVEESLRALRGPAHLRALSGSARAPGRTARAWPRARSDLQLERVPAAPARRARARSILRLRRVLGRGEGGETRARDLRGGSRARRDARPALPARRRSRRA